MQARRETFYREVLPEMFRQMKLLGIDINKVDEKWAEL